MTIRLAPVRQILCICRLAGKSQNGLNDRCFGRRSAVDLPKSLLLALNDHKIIPEREILGILRDAAAAHEGLGETAGDADLHAAVAALINRILAGGNSVRRRR